MYPKIYLAGHKGMVGSAILRQLLKRGQPLEQIITRKHTELDLTDQLATRNFFAGHKLDQVYIAAAKVGGIYANNTYPSEFIYQNLMIATNIIDAAFRNGVKKILFLGSSCIYPKSAPQPMMEDALLTGVLEPTNEPYAIAKIAGIKLCESYNRQDGISHDVDYRCAMPTNLYGPDDNYDSENSHVIAALIRRFHEAKMKNEKYVIIWGTGKVSREFLFVDDMATACVEIMNMDKFIYHKNTQPMLSHINVGSGDEVTIGKLAVIIKQIVGYAGEIRFDINKPEGVARKLLDSNRIKSFGWQPKIDLESGLKIAYQDFLNREAINNYKERKK
jgi:GDP-L-fucose synthase